MDHKYATKIEENYVKVLAKNLSISRKQCVEIARMIRAKSVLKAEAQLHRVMKMQEAVPFLKHNKHVAHKKGAIAAGRYPIKAVSHFLNLLNTLKANARNMNLDDSQIVIKAVVVKKGRGQFHYGRLRGRQHKRTHIEIIGVENKDLSSKKDKKKVVEKKEAKQDNKVASPKQNTKTTTGTKESKPKESASTNTTSKAKTKSNTSKKTPEKKENEVKKE